jgi:opacity protein-like surface antigen
MKKHLSLLAALLVAGTFSTPAIAADRYVSANIGLSWMNNIDVEDLDYTSASNENFVMDSGISLLGAVGCDYGSYRLEAELGYQTNDVNRLTYGSNSAVDFEGSVSVVSLLANGYVDLASSGVEPYVTAGVGVAQVSFNEVRPVAFGPAVDTNETTLAYQFGAGVAFPMGGNVMLDARYRYFATGDFWDNTSIASNSALLGLRIGF